MSRSDSVRIHPSSCGARRQVESPAGEVKGSPSTGLSRSGHHAAGGQTHPLTRLGQTSPHEPWHPCQIPTCSVSLGATYGGGVGYSMKGTHSQLPKFKKNSPNLTLESQYSFFVLLQSERPNHQRERRLAGKCGVRNGGAGAARQRQHRVACGAAAGAPRTSRRPAYSHQAHTHQGHQKRRSVPLCLVIRGNHRITRVLFIY